MKEQELKEVKEEITSAVSKFDKSSGASVESIRKQVESSDVLFEEAIDNLIDEGVLREEEGKLFLEKKPEQKEKRADFFSFGTVIKTLAYLLLFFIVLYINFPAGIIAGIVLLALNRKAIISFIKSIF